VNFNGKVTQPLAYDTGASSVVLPASLAAQIGLKPGKDDPTVRAQVADGSVVEAKPMTIPSVREGANAAHSQEAVSSFGALNAYLWQYRLEVVPRGRVSSEDWR
jgi:predicted aspartyl protease